MGKPEMTISESFAFELFPRAPLPPKINRRDFFRRLLLDARARHPEQTPNPAFKLADLGLLPDLELAQVIPARLPGSEIIEKDGQWWGSSPENREPVLLFPTDSPAVAVLRLFERSLPLVDVARSLASQLSWDKQFSFAYTRGVFLWLVMTKLYVPQERKH